MASLNYRPFFLYLSLLSVYHAMVKAATSCSKTPAFLNRIRDGVDVTTLDLLPINVGGQDGFRYPVFDFTCDFGITMILNGVEYEIPDQVWNTVIIPSGWLNSNVQIYKKSHHVKSSMSANVDVDIMAGLFSASGSYKKMNEYMTKSSKYIEDVTSFTAGYKITLMPDFLFEFGRGAKLYIERFLPKTLAESSYSAYMKFIRMFGTHYFSQAKFGGLIRVLLATDQSYFSKTTERTVEAQAKSTFFGLIKLGGGGSSSTQTVDTKFTKSTLTTVRYFGGSTNLLTADGIPKWQPTVADKPWLFGGSLTEISELVQDQDKRKSMKRAVQIHMDKAYLEELMRIIGTYQQTYKLRIYRGILNWYRKEIKKLQAQKFPDHDEILKIGQNVEKSPILPKWFNETQVCLSWYPDGDSSQCGGGADRLLCAYANNKTGYYQDNTDQRTGGCQMRWGIRSKSHDDWFKNVQLCYKWSSDGDDGQCGEKAAGEICAGVNSYTDYYKDDTDDRNGGCRMQWMLKVPNDAPLWIRKAKICYDWSPELQRLQHGFAYRWYDNKQCGGGAPKNLCAVANTYTQPYLDDTDKRPNGCKMRWGIVL